jgi:hypothetical protein
MKLPKIGTIFHNILFQISPCSQHLKTGTLALLISTAILGDGINFNDSLPLK